MPKVDLSGLMSKMAFDVASILSKYDPSLMAPYLNYNALAQQQRWTEALPSVTDSASWPTNDGSTRSRARTRKPRDRQEADLR